MHISDLYPGGLCPERAGHFIGGKFLTSTESFASVNPATGEILQEVPLGGAAEIDQAVAASQSALRSSGWAKLPTSERARVLLKIATLIERDHERLAKLESLDTGKPLQETINGDIPRAAANFRFFAELAKHQGEETFRDDPKVVHTSRREALGIVGLITPWNLPLYLATWKLAPALVQGNAVILKPAELTPLSSIALARVLNEAGVPPGLVNIVQGYGPNSAGSALVEHEGIRAISFTGETSTGKAIMQSAAPTLKKVSFELGGKGASVVFADADLASTAKTVCQAAFRNQGQICLAGSRLLVEEKISSQFTDLLLSELRAIKIGDPLDQATTMGSLISRAHRDKVHGFVEHARAEHEGKVLCGGEFVQSLPRGAFYAPTIIAGVAQDSRLIQDEIFGPVLTIQTFKTDDEALNLLNGTRYGLSCSIYTQNMQRAATAVDRAAMGLVWVNGWFLRDLHTAFGGQKQSGVGREGGRYSLDFFSDHKTVTYRFS